MFNLGSRTCAELGEHARKHNHPRIGILIKWESERVSEAGEPGGMAPPTLDWHRKTSRGLDVQIHYFMGARLK